MLCLLLKIGYSKAPDQLMMAGMLEDCLVRGMAKRHKGKKDWALCHSCLSCPCIFYFCHLVLVIFIFSFLLIYIRKMYLCRSAWPAFPASGGSVS